MYWTDNTGKSYGPFHVQPDGFPNAGEVVRHFRQLKGISCRQLAIQLGDVTPRWMQAMEKENKIPDTISRRSAIASILGIPPILLGLGDSKDLEPHKPISLDKAAHIDIRSLDDRLDFLYEAFNAGISPQYLRPQLNNAISLLLTNGTKEALVLLSKYYRSYSRIERDVNNTEQATYYIKQAEQVAKEIGDTRLYAIALHSHGWILEEQGKKLEAIPFIEHGYGIVKDDISSLAGCSYIDHAIILSKTVQDNKDRYRAEVLINKSEDIYYKSPSDKEKDGRLTQEVIHTNKARVYLNMGMLNKVEDELEEAENYIPASFTRRTATIEIIRAKYAYLSGDIMGALSCLETAYNASRNIRSQHNVLTIQQLLMEISNNRQYMAMKDVRSQVVALQM